MFTRRLDTNRARASILCSPCCMELGFGGPPPTGVRQDEFEQDFMNDIVPFVEKRYRVSTGKNDRAIAGLSMGGGQTLNIAVPHLDLFGYVGVYSSGLFGA